MNIRSIALPFVALFVGFSQQLAAAETPKVVTKPGYNVMVEVIFNEQGVTEDAKVVESDDPTKEEILNRIALDLAAELKQTPKLKEGKPVKFDVKVPFNFPVEDDEGPAANDAPKPSLHGKQTMPVFPEDLAAKNENGGVILELIIGTYGNVENIKVLRASHQEYADAGVAAVKTWIFNPTRKDGVNVESRWRIAIGFSANGKDVDWKWRVAPRPSLGGFTWVRPKLLPVAPADTAPVDAIGSSVVIPPSVPAPAPAK